MFGFKININRFGLQIYCFLIIYPATIHIANMIFFKFIIPPKNYSYIHIFALISCQQR